MKTKFIVLSMFLVLMLLSFASCRNSGLPFVAGAVVGAVVADTVINNNRHEHNRSRCYEEVNGEWRQDRYGRTYWQRFRHPKKVEVPCD
ncbi:MAG: hypothetical protein HQK62_01495 [Desulfamplus sp.]|nr:hypothetical protein [Desulfamplus sp.]